MHDSCVLYCVILGHENCYFMMLMKKLAHNSIFFPPIKSLNSSTCMSYPKQPFLSKKPTHIIIIIKILRISAMIPSEISGIHFLTQENQIQVPAVNLTMMQNNFPTFQFDTFLANLTSSQFPGSPLDLSSYHQPSSCLNNNSTSDEAEEQQLRIIDERKQRRMISNRESARRSRMRKQRHLDELWSQVVRLRNENHCLIDKLNHVSESHDKVLQENVRLKEEASDLRQMLTDLKIGRSFSNDALKAENSSNENTSVDDLLH